MQGTIYCWAVIIVGFVILICSSAEAASLRNNTVRRFFIRLQPELDVIDIDEFVRKDHVLNFQLKCLLNNDTYCDPIGRWLAPRLPFMLLRRQCPKCTDVQRSKISDGLKYIRRERPNIYQALVERYIVQDDEEEEEQELQDTEIKLDETTTTTKEDYQNDNDFTGTVMDSAEV